MASRSQLIDRLRLEMADFAYSIKETFVASEGQTRFDISRDNILRDSNHPFKVTVDGAPADASDFVLHEKQGLLDFTTHLPEGARVEIDGFYSEIFTDEQLGTWVDLGFALHGHETNPPLTYNNMSDVDAFMVVLLAKIETLWVLATDAAYDIDIRTVEGVSIPRSQRFAQIMALIQAIKARYDELAALLNVGPGRVEMLTLRRVSRTTNRLVPVYVPREVDDTRAPTRVYPPIDTRGATIPEPMVDVENLQVTRGKTFVKLLIFRDEFGEPIALDEHTNFKAKVWLQRHGPGMEVAEFEVDTENASTGSLTIILPRSDIEDLQSGHEYAWSMTWDTPDGDTDVTVVEGTLVVSDSLPHTRY